MAFEGRPWIGDESDDELELLGSIMNAERDAVIIRWAQAWFKVKEAEASAHAKAARSRKPMRSSRPRRRKF